MRREKYGKVYISWPDDEQGIYLDIPEEADEDPVDITDLAAKLIDIYWDKPNPLDQEDAENNVSFAEIVYPDKVRFFYGGKRVSMQRAHEAFETGFVDSIRIGLQAVQQKVDASTHEKTSIQ